MYVSQYLLMNVNRTCANYSLPPALETKKQFIDFQPQPSLQSYTSQSIIYLPHFMAPPHLQYAVTVPDITPSPQQSIFIRYSTSAYSSFNNLFFPFATVPSKIVNQYSLPYLMHAPAASSSIQHGRSIPYLMSHDISPQPQ